MRQMTNHTPRMLGMWVAVALVVAVLTPVAVSAAGGTFTDDDTSIFEADIEWLADAGVTLGCNPPANDNFCPDSPVTRGQMAAFMHRLAVNQVVDAATAVQAADADLLSGLGFSAYTNHIWGNQLAGVSSTMPDAMNRSWVEMEVGVDQKGAYLINASATIEDDTSTALAVFWIQVDNSTCSNTIENFDSVANGYAAIDLPPGMQSTALTGIALVTEGSHILTLCGREFGGGGGDTVVISPSMTAMFSAHVENPSSGVSAPAASGPRPGSIEE